MLYVTKFDGSKQPFVKGKVIRTCLRMHASLEQARTISNKVENDAYDGITTKQLFRLIMKYLKEYNPGLRHQTDLRTAISLLRPKPDFELFVGKILEELGYEIEINKFVAGNCIEHEIDVIAKNKETILVEVKHHTNPHIYIGLETFLEYWAAFEDMSTTREKKYNFDSLLIVCNTKVSDHAKKYAACKNIKYLAWKSPLENSLEKIVDEKKLYPITLMKGLDKNTEEKLCDKGIVLLKQLVETDLKQLHLVTGISIEKLTAIKNLAEDILLF